MMRVRSSHIAANYHIGGITGGLKVEFLDSLLFPRPPFLKLFRTVSDLLP